ncbi:helix-turn-helix transcriptional regulator [Streptomyces olivaceiscleroticus]|uniref:helix-turn-helix domain-containing protein n=1 Tax=Streptomyces olivaceiscleroticus TaxID=68245 RepID=UPI0031F8496B
MTVFGTAERKRGATMPSPKNLDPTESLPALYGTKLRKLRTKAGLTQRELGAKVPIAHSRIAQFELGKETPPEDVSAALDRLLGADGDLTDLWQHARRAPFPGWARRYVELEACAGRIRTYAPYVVHGLLQTESYARALLGLACPAVGDGLDDMLAARMARQAVLQRSEALPLWIVIDEAVLRRRVGGASVMRGQLEHLLRMSSELRQTTVQVLPFERGAQPMTGHPLTVLSFPGRSDVAYMEGVHSGELVEDPAAVAEYALAFEQLQAQALPPDVSADLLRTLLEGSPHDVRQPTRGQRRRLAQVQLQQRAGRRVRRGR